MKKLLVPSYFFISAGLMIFDRLSKKWALNLTQEYIVNQFISFELVFNPGISWGMLRESPLLKILIPIFISFLIAVLAYNAFSAYRQRKLILGQVLIIVGAISNLYDRLFWPGVIDFIQFHYQNWYFPSFNIADAAIVFGIFLMLYQVMQET